MTSCGCVSTTWYCSTNASSASFQFTGRRHAYHHSARSDSTFHASRMVANGSMHCRNGGASSSRLIHAHPPHTSHRTGVRSMSSGCRLCSANVRRLRDVGVRAVRPVAPAVERAGEPALARPPPSTTLTPRWRQAFWNARTPMSSVRSTMTDWSRISYSTKSRGCGISSSRHAICQTRGHSSSASIW